MLSFCCSRASAYLSFLRVLPRGPGRTSLALRTLPAPYHYPWSASLCQRRMSDPTVKFSDEELRSRLTAEQYRVTQLKGTERAFTGEYAENKQTGAYNCVVCGAELFNSSTKFDSGSGWPSFYDVAQKGTVALHEDTSHGMVRTEVTCAKCGAHLGHVFDDGPKPTGQRYCINSCSLKFEKKT